MAMKHFAGFRSVVDDPRLQPDPVVLGWLDHELVSYKNYAQELGLLPDFIQAMVQSYIECFRRLDALPRSDPFWDGSNRRPTKYRLGEFCRAGLQARPDDTALQRLLIAVQTIHLGFTGDDWNRLLELEPEHLRSVVEGCLSADLLGSNDKLDDLIAVCKSEDRLLVILPRVRDLSRSKLPYVVEGANDALKRLGEVGPSYP